MDSFYRDFYSNSVNLVKKKIINFFRKRHGNMLKQNNCSKITVAYEYLEFPYDGVNIQEDPNKL